MMPQATCEMVFPPRPRVVGRRLLRLLCIFPLLLALAYVTLPVWLPTGWIARRICNGLALGLHRPVHLGNLRVGWIDGVVLEDLRILERPGQPNEYLACVREARCPFQPISTLLGKVSHIELVAPQLWLAIGSDGQVKNLADLAGHRGGSLPSLRYTAEEAVCHLVTSDNVQQVRVDHLDCELQPRTGLLRLCGWATVHRDDPRPPLTSTGRFRLNAAVTVTKLRRDRTLGGEVHMEWHDLALTDLPLPVASRLPVRQIEGSTTGSLSLAPQPDLGVDFNLYIDFHRVVIQRAGLNRPTVIPDAVVQTRGHWDPNDETVVLDELDYETPAILVCRAASAPPHKEPALRFDNGGEFPLKLNLAGEIKEWQDLLQEIPEVDALADTMRAQASGSARFRLWFEQRRRRDHLVFELDGTRSDWRLGGKSAAYFAASAGIPKKLQVDLLQTRPAEPLMGPPVADAPPETLAVTAARLQSKLGLTVGDVSLNAAGHMPFPGAADSRLLWLYDALWLLQWQVEARTGHLDEACAFFPWLAAAGLDDAGGPAEARFTLGPHKDAARLEVSLATAPHTSFTWREVISKRSGTPLSLHAGALLSQQQDGALVKPWLDLQVGGCRMNLDPEKAKLVCRFASERPEVGESGGSVAIDAACELPLRVNQAEDLFGLLGECDPELRDALAGSAGVTLRSRLAYRPGDWLLSSELDVSGDDLTLRWHDVLDKPAGPPTSLRLSHRWHSVAARSEQVVNAALIAPGASVAGSLALGTDGGFEHVAAHVRVEDIESLLAVSPRWAAEFSRYQPAGQIELQISDVLVGGRQRLSVSADATAAAWVLPGESPLAKAAGVPAHLAMLWEADAVDAAGAQTWKLLESKATLPGLDAAFSGNVAVDWEGAPAGPAQRVWRRDTSRPRLVSASLHSTGACRFEPALAALDPRIRECYERYRLTGRAGYDFRLAARPGAVDLAGRIDAERSSFAIAITPASPAPTVSKAAGVPAGLDFDVTVSRQRDYRLQVREANFDIAGNLLSANGHCDLSPDNDGGVRLSGGELAAEFDLNHASAVGAMLPDAALSPASGRASGTVKVGMAEGRPAVHSADLRFTNFALQTPAERLQLDGDIAFDGRQLSCDRFAWAWGPSQGALSGSVQSGDGGHTGRFGVALGQVDLPDLTARIAKLRGDAPPVPAAPGLLPRLLDEMARADLEVDVYAANVRAALPLDVRVNLEAASAAALVKNGPLASSFRCVVDGGVVTGSFEIKRDGPDPTYRLVYSAERIQPGPVVDTYLKLTFPGMHAAGPLTLIDESNGALTGPDAALYPTGIGEFIIEGGYVEGRAAPAWVTRIFPGLNLARFDFSYMHSWFEKFSDGRCRHQMIYRGKFYNIYSIGYGDATGHIDYEIGIDFFADFDSKYWADTGSGRIPLFTKTGRNQPDGTLADEVVAYSSPVRVMKAIVVENNPLYTAYHAVRKRVRNEK